MVSRRADAWSGRHRCTPTASWPCSIARVNYELYMGAALAEAAAAVAAGERPDGAVAVVDEAMVARGRPGLRSTGDPTSHAVVQRHP